MKVTAYTSLVLFVGLPGSQSTSSPGFAFLVSRMNGGETWCLSTTEGENNVKLLLAECQFGSAPESQLWKLDENHHLRSLTDPDKCVVSDADRPAKILRLKSTCSKDEEENTYTLEPFDGDATFRLHPQHDAELCLTKKNSLNYFSSKPCKTTKAYQWYWKSPSEDKSETTTGLAVEWLKAHNSRRTELHEQYNKEPVLLKWSQELADSAQAYTESLLDGFGASMCRIQHGFNGDKYGGENLAAQVYPGVGTVAPDSVLQQWFEGEAGYNSFPSNGHYTQVGWRATEYLGCGQASKLLDTGYTCHIQTCRYLKPGNCNVGGNWLEAMLRDDSLCGPECPVKEGCF